MNTQNREKEPGIAFISYAHKDSIHLTQLEVHLKNLERQGILRSWNHQHISAGTPRKQAIDRQLNTASIILLLISPDFMAEDYCYSIEMTRAIERHLANEALVIPILLRPTNLKGTPIEPLQVLPLNNRPITKWKNRDQGWLNVEEGICTAIEHLPMLTVSPSLSSVPHVTVSSPSSLVPGVWNISYRRNPFFTGRDKVLTLLADTLNASKVPVQAQAISGLAGMGKTQIALEYAYRYQENYQAILWAQADTREVLISACVNIAQLLNLPEKDAQDQTVVVAAFLQWMKTRNKWLLILDNVEDLEMVSEFIPPIHNGHILLTTRIQATGQFAQLIEVEKMSEEIGALFLLKRAKLIADDISLEEVPERQQAIAQEIVGELDGLPLALDQAGAYVEESELNLHKYLQLYHQEQTKLLQHRHSGKDHRESVVTTLALSFRVVEQISPIAADLLRLCAFLHADAIPEEIITEGAASLGPLLQVAASTPLVFNEAIRILRSYSLIKRDNKRNTLSVHRLVQVVLKHELDSGLYLQWAERAVKAVSAVFPEAEAAMWARCERCFPHAHVCLQLIEESRMEFPEAVRLLTRMGWYLKEYARYKEAELIVERARLISNQRRGPEETGAAQTLNVLAGIYEAQGRYAEAEPLYLQALNIYERLLGPEHAHTVRNLNNLACVYAEQGRNAEAEQIYRRTLAIREQILGPEHPDTAESLNNLACCYEDQGKYTEAEVLYQRALAIYEQLDHPDRATILNNLAELYRQQEKYAEAEPLYQRALTIYEGRPGSGHHDTAHCLHNLAGLYLQQKDYVKAMSLCSQALIIYQQLLDPNHPDIANCLNTLGRLYFEQGKYAEAKSHLNRALEIFKQRPDTNHSDTANCLHSLARLYDRQGQYVEAKPLYEQALSIREQYLGRDHPHTLITIEKYNNLLQKMGIGS